MKDKAPTWESERLDCRLQRCRAMLGINGMLTISEELKVQARIDKSLERLARAKFDGKARSAHSRKSFAIKR